MRWRCCPPAAARTRPDGSCERSATAGSCTTRPNASAAARTRSQQHHDDAQATEARQEQRDRRLAGWTAAISDALTDTQLTAAVDRVTWPVDGLDRRSVPVAASRLLAWAVTTTTSAPDKPLHDAPTDALHDHSTHRTDDSSTLPAEIPRPPATPDAAADPDAFDDASSMRSTTSRQRTSPVSRSLKEAAMHRRHPYGRHPTAALNLPASHWITGDTELH